MESEIILSLTLSLGLTMLLETAFFVLTRHRNKRDLRLLLLVNLLTNPAVVMLHILLVRTAGLPEIMVVIPLEIAAVLAEFWYYRRYAAEIRRPLLFSAGANIFSYTCGLILIKII